MCSSRIEHWNSPASKPNCFHGEQTMWCTLTMKPLDFSGTSTKRWRSQILHPASVDLVVSHTLHTPPGTHTLPPLTLPWAVRELFTGEYPLGRNPLAIPHNDAAAHWVSELYIIYLKCLCSMRKYFLEKNLHQKVGLILDTEWQLKHPHARVANFHLF